MEKLRKTFLAFAVAIACLTFTFQMTGCNTVEGAGEDVEAAGEGIQDAAD